MKLFMFLFALCALGEVSFSQVNSNDLSESAGGGSGADTGNVFCGPLCVKRVLEFYGVESDLIQIVQKVQWPDTHAGASLVDIIDCLADFGVEVAPVEFPPQATLQYEFPVILHLKSRRAKHYVVWLPPNDNHPNPRIWDPAKISIVRDSSDLSFYRSGTILLTAPDPIRLPVKLGIQYNPPMPSAVMIVLLVFLTATLVYVGNFIFRLIGIFLPK